MYEPILWHYVYCSFWLIWFIMNMNMQSCFVRRASSSLVSLASSLVSSVHISSSHKFYAEEKLQHIKYELKFEGFIFTTTINRTVVDKIWSLPAGQKAIKMTTKLSHPQRGINSITSDLTQVTNAHNQMKYALLFAENATSNVLVCEINR